MAKKKSKKTTQKQTEIVPQPKEEPPQVSTNLDPVNPKDVQKKLEKMHEECPKYHYCTRKEFLIGMMIGIFIGLLSYKILEIILRQ